MIQGNISIVGVLNLRAELQCLHVIIPLFFKLTVKFLVSQVSTSDLIRTLAFSIKINCTEISLNLQLKCQHKHLPNFTIFLTKRIDSKDT